MGMRGRLAIGYPPNCQFHFFNFHGLMVHGIAEFVQEPENPENSANGKVVRSRGSLTQRRAETRIFTQKETEGTKGKA